MVTLLNQSEYLMKGMWYGEIQNTNVAQLRELILNNNANERELVINLVEVFKLGDFSLKNILINLMNTTKDESVLNLCIRAFSSIATAKDIHGIDNFVFLENASDNAVSTFLSCTDDFLSYEIVPHLLALLEIWEDIDNIDIQIRDSLETMLGFRDELGEDAELDEIGNYYLEYIESEEINLNAYYYDKKLFFPGNLTKPLLECATSARYLRKKLKTYTIPSLLSIWSGKKCPVEYHTLVTDELYRDTLNYVQTLSEMEWELGKKYFYGHLIQ